MTAIAQSPQNHIGHKTLPLSREVQEALESDAIRAALAKEMGDISPPSQGALDIVSAWFAQRMTPSHIAKGRRERRTWLTLLAVHCHERITSRRHPLVGNFAMALALSEPEASYPEQAMERPLRYLGLQDRLTILKQAHIPDKRSYAAAVLALLDLLRDVSDKKEISYDDLTKMDECLLNLQQKQSQALKASKELLDSFQEAQGENDPEDLSESLHDHVIRNHDSWLKDAKNQFDREFVPPEPLPFALALLENLRSSKHASKIDKTALTSMLEGLGSLPFWDAPGEGHLMALRLMLLSLSPHPAKDARLEEVGGDFSYNFVKALGNGLMDRPLTQYRENRKLRDFVNDAISRIESSKAQALEARKATQEALAQEARSQEALAQEARSLEARSQEAAAMLEGSPARDPSGQPRAATLPQGPPDGPQAPLASDSGIPGFEDNFSELSGLTGREAVMRLSQAALGLLREGAGKGHGTEDSLRVPGLRKYLRLIAERLLELGDTASLHWLSAAAEVTPFSGSREPGGNGPVIPRSLARLLYLGLNFEPRNQANRDRLKQALEGLQDPMLLAPLLEKDNAALLAASVLRPAVLAPDAYVHTVVEGLAGALEDEPGLKDLFVLLGERILHTDDEYQATVRQLFHRENLGKLRADLEERTRRYEDRARAGRIKYVPANKMWQSMIKGPNSFIRELLDMAYEGKDLETLADNIGRFESEDAIKEDIQQWSRTEIRREIMGDALQTLINNYQDALAMAKAWLDYHRYVSQAGKVTASHWRELLREYSSKAGRALKSLPEDGAQGLRLLRERLGELAALGREGTPPSDANPPKGDPMLELLARLVRVPGVSYEGSGHKPPLEAYLAYLAEGEGDPMPGFLGHLDSQELLVPYAFLTASGGDRSSLQESSLRRSFTEALSSYPQAIMQSLDQEKARIGSLRQAGALPPGTGAVLESEVDGLSKLLQETMPTQNEEWDEDVLEDDPDNGDLGDDGDGGGDAGVYELAKRGLIQRLPMLESDPYALPSLREIEALASIRAELRLLSERTDMAALSVRTSVEASLGSVVFHHDGQSGHWEHYLDYAHALARDNEPRAAVDFLSGLASALAGGQPAPSIPVHEHGPDYRLLFNSFLEDSLHFRSPFELTDAYAHESGMPITTQLREPFQNLLANPGADGPLALRLLDQLLKALGFQLGAKDISAPLQRGGAPDFLRVHTAGLTLSAPLPAFGGPGRQDFALILSWAPNP
ncbi:MAG: hypothetical protein LBF40_03505, partial [Deltaproteobacteria bacterium]|nr:hypothetical protein [Deltaproteobacteria bacterium]